ncbi:unnamed protein product [Eruca vesicaria subsp. sativa]|uniref:Uncharacterized protein n=1 Tax=Eruca vesicaria subsp. sativa TaxID=29727 RepID=A0ABC8KDK6_ERUVS|nr:unnamed protein product [Eruca vesicaria subsp. sativa]
MFSCSDRDERAVLQYRMSHEARRMGGKRRLLNMPNPNNHINSGSSLKELDQQICLLNYRLLSQWRLNKLSDRDETRKKLTELVMEREKINREVPGKTSQWNSSPFLRDLRKQIEVISFSS